ncbi:MAG: hypothetical protein FWC23_04520, partial [Chitinispirillia bacterium]|nr:hypothetical protein [Chitinispirillia bacterium]MCL2268431.1 hypothetical protein [Chitinispirillia bacterium]
EADAYDGPSIIIAYSHCISHGINMSTGYNSQKEAVESGHWPLYRYNPALDNPLQIDSKDPTMSLADYAYKENRYKILQRNKPEESKRLMEMAQQDVTDRLNQLKHMASQK